jgi:uncharacterized protein YecE (DUF72 family)
MQFGKITDYNLIAKLNFDLPADNFLIDKKSDAFQIYFAGPAWGIKEWVGKIYPDKTPSTKFLYHYSRNFSAIELNSAHYAMPSKETIQKWLLDVPDQFLFCPKVPKQISHFGGMNNQQVVSTFFDQIRDFKQNLGITFMQLNEHFAPARIAELRNFVNFRDKNQPLAIEFRHSDWFKDPKIFQALAKHNIGAIVTDVVGNRDVLHANITSTEMVVRFVGNNLHPTDFTRIDLWIEKLKHWKLHGVNKVYFFLHEPDDVMCPELADYFVQQVNASGLATLERINFLDRLVLPDQIGLI